MPRPETSQIQPGRLLHAGWLLVGLAVLVLAASWFAWQWVLSRVQPIDVTEPIEQQVTSPEGWRVEEIARRLTAERLVADEAAFYQALRDHADTGETNPLGRGQLFPDTYRFLIDGSPSLIAEKLLENAALRTQDLTPSSDQLILASIVEREAKHPDDRPLIAGVYANRLAIGMKLDADPTVQFAKANQTHPDCVAETHTADADCSAIDWWPTLVTADYQSITSPFNTYRVAGLPPTPIAEPGLASIQAALNPTDHDYLYFITDADGAAHFATTLAEHNQNKARYLQ